MANTAVSSSPLQQFNSLTQMHFVRQIVFMLVIAAGVALSTAIILWSTGGNYTALYMDLSTQDTSDVINILEQNGTDYQIEQGTGIITVSADQVQQTRLLLANNGLPRSSSRGYDMLEDEVSLGTSNFIEQARYNRALEQELVQTIKRLRGVRDARVHLSIPKQTSFLRNNNQANASVMLDLSNPQALNDMQIAGVAHLVSSSISGLEAENVSVVDQRGNLLSRNEDNALTNTNENIRFTRNMEQEYTKRIIAMLSPIVGAGNIHAQVTADLDFTVSETTQENFNPTTASIRSEQIQEENSVGSNNGTGIEPGTLSPNPPLDNANAILSADQLVGSNNSQTRINSTRNFELDKTINHTRSVPGSINRLTVAVLVDLHPTIAPAALAIDPDADPDAPPPAAPEAVEEVIDPVLDQEKLDRITQLVQNSIGFDPARGDSVNVINETFFAISETRETPVALPIWQQEWVIPAAKQAGAALIVIYLLFGVLKPALKSAVSSQSNLPVRGGAALAGAGNLELSGAASALSDDAAAAALKGPTKSAYDENLSLAQELVQNEPARAARMIKDWVSNDQA